ncbi:MAG: hypothetical protein JWO67_6016 [Streptosporangiaceae bacterium]|nr:hypothetical protein [Streptosporangiaceae bacterium]
MSKPRWFLLMLAAVLVAALSAPHASAQTSARTGARTGAPSETPVTDPIPEKPIVSGLSLTLHQVATLPKSAPVPPPTDPRLNRWARINYLGQLPDGRMYVPDLNGKLYMLQHGQPHEYLDLSTVFAPDFASGRGLGSGFAFVTFHPDFARNGKFYTVHTEAGNALTARTADWTQPGAVLHGVLTEWTAKDPSAGTFSGTHRELLRLGFAGVVHGFQQIDFNPTARRGDKDYGLLYVTAGDGGRGATTDDPQNLSIPHGKILRIDPQGTNSPNGKYGIPATNPFAGRPGALGEIYAVGMRDPHRFSWDPRWPHRMYLGHIGEHAIESIYEVRAGDNFGWSEREGSFVYNKADRCHLYTLPQDDKKYGYTYPVAAYDHDPPAGWPCTADSGHAVIGGFVYRGLRIPSLYGKYVFGDGVDGRLFYTVADEMRRGSGERATMYQLGLFDDTGRQVTMQDLAGGTRVDLRFGRDNAGELYILCKANGKVWKVTGARWAKS